MADLDPYATELVWILVVGLIIAFVLAFGIGANDVANSFGTSVGSKVLTLRQACILATIFEILGSILIGAKVSDTIRKGIIDPTLFANSPKELMLGQVSSLLGCCIWLLVATFFNLPVSGTHSIVGATVGFALVARGARGIQWIEFAKIAGSWFASPALAGIISIAVFWVIRRFILEQREQLNIGLRWLPVFYSVTIMINVFSILLSAPPLLYFDRIPLWGKFVTTIGVGMLVALVVMFIVKPRLRSSIETALKKKRDYDQRGEEPQLTKSEGRFDTYAVTGLESVHTADKETQNDYVSMVQDWDMFRQEKPSNDQIRPYVEIPRIRKDSETPSNVAATTMGRIRRESERSRNESVSLDAANGMGQRTGPHLPATRERTKIYRMTQYNNPTLTPGPIASENKSLLLAVESKPHDDETSNASVTQHSLNGDSDEVDDAMPNMSDKAKKVDTTNDSIEVAGIFKYLQILTAIFGAFAHGGNDVSNAIGPLIGLWLIFVDGSSTAKSQTPLWVLFYGGLGISVGLWVWGRRVIRTIGEDLTKITPSSGFVIEISTAFTVLVASNLSIPVSTTHCKVGSVVAIGRIRSKESVDWSLFRNIFVAWIVTVPVTGGIAAGVMALLRLVFL